MDTKKIISEMEKLKWYHTVELAPGVETPGDYDIRKYLQYYGLPEDLSGKRVLDVGAASGFFSFEFERRGAEVVAVDLPNWMAHDLSETYQLDSNIEEAESYLLDPFNFAKEVRGSLVERKLLNIYDISPETVGLFDLVFCGSVLLHLTDPIRALWSLQSVTKGMAIITTGIYPDQQSEPLARFWGHNTGTTWWLPNRSGLEAMMQTIGFNGWEWYSDFRLDYRNGEIGTHHGVIRAWNDKSNFELPPIQKSSTEDKGELLTMEVLHRKLQVQKDEIDRLQELVDGYENGRVMRIMKHFNQILLR
jgi:tRNA (mo5U34)-methyltransferase